MKKFLSLLTLAALACAAPTLTLAAKKATPTPAPAGATPAPAAASTPAPKSVRPFPYYGDVDTVEPSAKTFTFKSQKGHVRTFHVGQTAKITKDSKDGPAADFSIITVGAYAAGSCTKTGDGQYEVVTLHVGAKPVKKEKATPAPKSPSTSN